MYEFQICHKHCGQVQTIYGYDFYDACKRWKVNADLWQVIACEFVD